MFANSGFCVRAGLKARGKECRRWGEAMNKVRRADREIKDPNAIRKIMEEAPVCRIGVSDDGMPYVVPMSFGLGERDLYVHCAAEGRLLDIIRRNDRVCVEMDLFRGGDPGSVALRLFLPVRERDRLRPGGHRG